MKQWAFCGFSLLMAVSHSDAGSETFECKVSALYELSSEGLFISDAPYQKKQVGSTFSVDRKTGAIRGGYFLNNRYHKYIRVINVPSDGDFYVISHGHGPIVQASYLYIGNNRDDLYKPFTFTSSGRYVYTGTCL